MLKKLSREAVGSGQGCPHTQWGAVWGGLNFIFFHTKTVHFGAYFAQFYGLDVEDLLFVQFMFYSGLLYNFTQNVVLSRNFNLQLIHAYK